MKKIRPLTFTIIAFLFYLTVSGQRNNINADSVNLTLQSILEKYNIPGISLVIAKSDTILFINSTGVRNLSTLESLKIADRMHIGSCTKAITGFAAGALVKVGLIKWESTIIEIFPEFKNTIKRDYYNTTLKDLLSHHARVLPFDSLEEWIEMDKKDQFKGKNLIEKRCNFSQWVLGKEQVKIDSLKGKEDFVYSNAGYVIATSMLERVTGEPWEKLIKKICVRTLRY